MNRRKARKLLGAYHYYNFYTENGETRAIPKSGKHMFLLLKAFTMLGLRSIFVDGMKFMYSNLK